MSFLPNYIPPIGSFGMTRFIGNLDGQLVGAGRLLGHAQGIGNFISGGQHESQIYASSNGAYAYNAQSAELNARMRYEAQQRAYYNQQYPQGGQAYPQPGYAPLQPPSGQGYAPPRPMVPGQPYPLNQSQNQVPPGPDDREKVGAFARAIYDMGHEQDPAKAQAAAAALKGRMEAAGGVFHIPGGMTLQGKTAGEPQFDIPAGNYSPVQLTQMIAGHMGVSSVRDNALAVAFNGQTAAPAARSAAAAPSPATGPAAGASVPPAGGTTTSAATPNGAATAVAGDETTRQLQAHLERLGLKTQGSKYAAAVAANGGKADGVPFDGISGTKTNQAIEKVSIALHLEGKTPAELLAKLTETAADPVKFAALESKMSMFAKVDQVRADSAGRAVLDSTSSTRQLAPLAMLETKTGRNIG